MKTACLAIALLAAPAAAQPDLKIQDRHPAYAGDPAPVMVRTIPIRPEGPVHSFEERWEPVRELLRDQAARQAMSQPNAPAASAARTAAPRPAAKVADRARDLCGRHGLRKVVTNGGRSWRCR